MGFLILFMIRLDLMDKLFFRPQTLPIANFESPADKETWLNIFQGNRKIGFSHTRFSKEKDGYHLQESVLMRVNTMGMVQDINLKTRGRLNSDFSLADFDFIINSGRFSFNMSGSVSGKVLRVRTSSAGTGRTTDIPLKTTPYLLPAITAAISAIKLKIGDKFTFDIFDPATMAQTPVIVEVVAEEHLQIMGDIQPAIKVSLIFKGNAQYAWIGENGDVLKEEGLLGIQMVKATREEALANRSLASSEDLTKIASIASNVVLDGLDRISILKFEFDGIPFENIQLNGGRQTFQSNILTIEKEDLADLSNNIRERNLAGPEKIFLKAGPFIQSDNPKIQALVQDIVGNYTEPLMKVRKLVDWVYQNIDKRPVLSLPDALSTLENRIGDCNEHAVLLAALARAAGIPCRIEAGLAYFNGRFYYHAWNRVYLGRWITVDSVFGQIPADVSHIRLVSGSISHQLDLMGIIGKLKLKVLE